MTLPFLHYELPDELIAQHPPTERESAKLLVVRKSTGQLEHARISDLVTLLSPGDLLVLNNTRVVPARLLGKRATTSGRWEGLYLRTLPTGAWELLCQTRGKLQVGEEIVLEPTGVRLKLLEKTPDKHWLAQPLSTEPTLALLDAVGQIPLPPYIRKGQAQSEDRARYQTVYATAPGAVAAPTAGLHFTEPLLAKLREVGVEHAYVTLHVGVGTFQPIQVADYRAHSLHHEWIDLPQATVTALAACRARGGRVLAVGTTSVRVLESVAQLGPLRAWQGETNLYIYPPFEFRVVQGMLTNFHLPRSTLLLLVGAFAGCELLERAYQEALSARYRFYSYGDAMLVLP